MVQVVFSGNSLSAATHAQLIQAKNHAYVQLCNELNNAKMENRALQLTINALK
jgi:hypothetical protein